MKKLKRQSKDRLTVALALRRKNDLLSKEVAKLKEIVDRVYNPSGEPASLVRLGRRAAL